MAAKADRGRFQGRISTSISWYGRNYEDITGVAIVVGGGAFGNCRKAGAGGNGLGAAGGR